MKLGGGCLRSQKLGGIGRMISGDIKRHQNEHRVSQLAYIRSGPPDSGRWHGVWFNRSQLD